jgi:hypothetical protein
MIGKTAGFQQEVSFWNFCMTGEQRRLSISSQNSLPGKEKVVT